MPRAPLYAYSFVAALVLLAALALHLARRSPAWRPVAASLAALAAIDVARLWTAPLGATRAQPWWGLDVALVALWPVAVAVGLLRAKANGHVFSGRRPADVTEPVLTEHGPVGRPNHDRGAPSQQGQPARGIAHDADGIGRSYENTASRDAGVVASAKDVNGAWRVQVHPPILPRLALLAALALVLGACRPALPALAYLGALRALRWGLAGLWVEALVDRWAGARIGQIRAASVTLSGATPRRDGIYGTAPKHVGNVSSAPLACALVLAGCNVAGLLAGAWLVPPWEPPAWALAGPVTWAAYVVCGVVMGREAWVRWNRRC